MRFYWRVLRLSHACCLPHSAKQNGLRNAPVLFRRGSGSPFVRSQASYGYRACLVHLELVRCLMAIPMELRNRRRSVSTILREHINFAMVSAGRTLGLRAPDCAKESNVEAALRPLWTLFF